MELRARHLRAAELLCHPALSDSEVAKAVGCKPATLSKWKSDPDFREEVERQRALIEDARTTDAASDLDRLHSLAMQAAEDILRREPVFEGHTKEGEAYMYAAPPSVVASMAKTVIGKTIPDRKAIEATLDGTLSVESDDERYRRLVRDELMADDAADG